MTRRPTLPFTRPACAGAAVALVGAVVLAAVDTDRAGAAPSPEANSVTAYGVVDHGPPGAQQLAAPVAGIAATPTGNGYWLVADDGGVFTYGDATFHGSAGNLPLTAPITGIAPTPTGNGYWLVADDGGVFTYGGADFLGSTAGRSGIRTTAIAADPDGRGYWILRRDGQIDGFAAADVGDPADADPELWPLHPSIDLAASPRGGGYWVAHGVPVLIDDEDQGGAVLAVERRLDGLGYWVGAPDRVFDSRTTDAVIAFQKHEGLPVDGVVGSPTLQALVSAVPATAVTTSGDALEVDRSRALVHVVVDGTTRWVFNAETGASTPTGTFEVLVALDGDVASSPFGPMNRPLMFTADGNAIAGSDEPLEIDGTTAGVVRVSDAAIDNVWDEGTGAPGTPVVIHAS